MEKAPSTTSAASFAGSATPRPLVSFTCFLKLPPELRTMIWEAVANQPRNVDIWARDDGPCEEWCLKEDLDTLGYTSFKFWTTQPVPGILHASFESRQIGLKFYQLSFGTKRWPEEMLCSKAPRIYRNFAADRICPMEELRPAPHLELFCSSEHPLASCAFNLHRRKKLHPDFDSLTDATFINAESFHREVLLYYDERLVINPGLFSFIEAIEENSTKLEWETLTAKKAKLLERLEAWEGFHKRRRRSGLWAMPKIKLVRLTIDGQCC